MISTYADSGTKPLGKSRNESTTSVRPRLALVPATLARERVVLYTWGFRQEEADYAKAIANRDLSRRWEIVDTRESTGAPCTLDPTRKGAVSHAAGFDWAWVAVRETAVEE